MDGLWCAVVFEDVVDVGSMFKKGSNLECGQNEAESRIRITGGSALADDHARNKLTNKAAHLNFAIA